MKPALQPLPEAVQASVIHDHRQVQIALFIDVARRERTPDEDSDDSAVDAKRFNSSVGEGLMCWRREPDLGWLPHVRISSRRAFSLGKCPISVSPCRPRVSHDVYTSPRRR